MKKSQVATEITAITQEYIDLLDKKTRILAENADLEHKYNVVEHNLESNIAKYNQGLDIINSHIVLEEYEKNPNINHIVIDAMMSANEEAKSLRELIADARNKLEANNSERRKIAYGSVKMEILEAQIDALSRRQEAVKMLIDLNHFENEDSLSSNGL